MRIRMLLVAIAVIFATSVALLSLPGVAAADHNRCGWANPSCEQELASRLLSARPNHDGWARVYCDFHTTSQLAWHWSGSWRGAYRACNAWVWAKPYGGGWMWAWSSSTGWAAMRGDALIIPAA